MATIQEIWDRAARLSRDRATADLMQDAVLYGANYVQTLLADFLTPTVTPGAVRVVDYDSGFRVYWFTVNAVPYIERASVLQARLFVRPNTSSPWYLVEEKPGLSYAWTWPDVPEVDALWSYFPRPDGSRVGVWFNGGLGQDMLAEFHRLERIEALDPGGEPEVCARFPELVAMAAAQWLAVAFQDTERVNTLTALLERSVQRVKRELQTERPMRLRSVFWKMPHKVGGYDFDVYA